MCICFLKEIFFLYMNALDCLLGGGYLYYYSNSVAVLLKSSFAERECFELVSYGIYILLHQLLMLYHSDKPQGSTIIALCIDFLIT
jgi:hypothetical protein